MAEVKDEEQVVQAKIGALLVARNNLLHQQPSDMVAIAHLTEFVVDLTAQQQALSSSPNVPPVTKEKADALKQALDALDRAVKDSAAVSQILAAATTLAKA